MLEVHVVQTPGLTLPLAEDHPFWTAMEALGDSIWGNFERYGLTEPHRSACTADSVGHGSVVKISSDTPDWAHAITIDLPKDAQRRQEIVELIEVHLSAARRALPDATWKATLGGRDVAWDAAEGFKLPATD